MSYIIVACVAFAAGHFAGDWIIAKVKDGAAALWAKVKGKVAG